MAGMFSMLNNHMSAGEGNQAISATSSRDNILWGRNVAQLAAPTNIKRNQRTEFSRSSYKVGKDRKIVSKKGKPGKFEIHPLLRRGICTVITAAIILVMGIVILVVDIVKQTQAKVCIVGWIIVSVASILIIAGILWTRRSQIKLRELKEARKKNDLKKFQRQMERYGEGNSMSMLMTSQHAIQWPTKKACPSLTCSRNTKISANGNHLEKSDKVSSSSSDDDTNHKIAVTTKTPACERKNKKSFHRCNEYPLRITKHGKLNPIPPSEYIHRAWYTCTDKHTFLMCDKHSNFTQKYISNAM